MLTPFDFERPETFEEALKLASVCDHRLIGGGTDVLVQIRAMKRAPNTLISLHGIKEMKQITVGKDSLFIGAGASLSAVENSEAVKRYCPILSKAVSLVGSPQIRNTATLGGNVGTASPAGDGLIALIAENAEAEICSLQESRVIPLSELVTGPKRTALRKDEIIKGFFVPLHQRWSYADFFKIGKRNSLAISIVNGSVKIHFENGIVKNASIVLGAVAPTPLHMHAAEKLLTGKKITEALLDELDTCIRASVAPIDDIRASGKYRRYIAGVKCTELVRNAWEADTANE